MPHNSDFNPCEHEAINVPVCTCCLHFRITDMLKSSGIPSKLADHIADAALACAVKTGRFENPNG